MDDRKESINKEDINADQKKAAFKEGNMDNTVKIDIKDATDNTAEQPDRKSVVRTKKNDV